MACLNTKSCDMHHWHVI